MLIFGLLLLIVVIAGFFASRGMARAVGPGSLTLPATTSVPQIEHFDAHPRHVCPGEEVIATWRALGEVGTLTAVLVDPVPPFLRLDFDPLPREHMVPVAAAGDSFHLHFDVFARDDYRHPERFVTQTVTIHSIREDRPNLYSMTVVPTFSVTGRIGWLGTRHFSSNPNHGDDWSQHIVVNAFQYREGGAQPITVFWNGHEVASLSPVMPDHLNSEIITVVGDWRLFVRARSGDGPTTPPPPITIILTLRCASR